MGRFLEKSHNPDAVPSVLTPYDNSTQFKIGQAISEPTLLLEMSAAKRVHPAMLVDASNTPEWAKPALEVAFELHPGH